MAVAAAMERPLRYSAHVSGVYSGVTFFAAAPRPRRRRLATVAQILALAAARQAKAAVQHAASFLMATLALPSAALIFAAAFAAFSFASGVFAAFSFPKRRRPVFFFI